MHNAATIQVTLIASTSFTMRKKRGADLVEIDPRPSPKDQNEHRPGKK